MSNTDLTPGIAGRLPHNASDSKPWRAVLSVAFTASAFCSSEFLPVGLLRFVSAGLHVSEGMAGTMVTVPGILAAIAAPLITMAVGNLDRKRVLLGLGLMQRVFSRADGGASSTIEGAARVPRPVG